MDAPVTAIDSDSSSRITTTSSSREKAGLFAEQLARVQAQKEQQPVALVPATKTEEPEAETPKIARSWRMAGAEKATQVQENLDLDWEDVVDLLNPLHHIPVVGTIYREITGDKIAPEIQIAGSVAFGALTGSIVFSAIAGIAGAAYEESTGQEATVQIAQALFGNDVVGGPSPTAGEVQVAAAELPADSLAPAPKAAPVTAVSTEIAAARPAAASGGMRVGNIIYASPALKSAAKVSAEPPPSSKGVVYDAVQEARAALASAEKKPSDQTETASTGDLGVLMREQAQAKAAGNALPPELVHDMMLMALDKYKAAHALSGDDFAAIP